MYLKSIYLNLIYFIWICSWILVSITFTRLLFLFEIDLFEFKYRFLKVKSRVLAIFFCEVSKPLLSMHLPSMAMANESCCALPATYSVCRLTYFLSFIFFTQPFSFILFLLMYSYSGNGSGPTNVQFTHTGPTPSTVAAATVVATHSLTSLAPLQQ